MKFIEKYRAEIVVIVVLPISYGIWLVRAVQRWLSAPSPEQHTQRVLRVCKDVRLQAGGKAMLRSDRSPAESHAVRVADKSAHKQVSMRDLRAILGLSDGALHVEPGVTVGEATKWLLKRDPPLQLECTLEMGKATLGGLALATGMTTHSHVCGLIHDTITQWEVVSGSGEVVVATATNEHSDLFRALPWSHGSLGLLCSLKLRVIPAKRWVKLTYTPLRSIAAIVSAYEKALERTAKGGTDVPFFLEMSVVSKSSAVLMEGRLDDGQASVPRNHIGLWFKPWFFKHVEAKLEPGAQKEELIPLWDYLMRHDRCMCTTMSTVIPYGNTLWFRWLLGWLMPPQVSFLKASHTAETREASIRKQVYQDVAFPAKFFGDALQLADDLFDVYPLMVYPCLVRDHGGMIHLPDAAKEQMFLNLGIYGIPRNLRENSAYPFRMATAVRQLESWIRSVGGFQHTYCDSFQHEEEFNSMFDHSLWTKMRSKYSADKAFPNVYDKTRPEMDIWAFLAEEEKAA